MPFKGHRGIISFVRYEVFPVVNILRLQCSEMLQLVMKWTETSVFKEPAASIVRVDK